MKTIVLLFLGTLAALTSFSQIPGYVPQNGLIAWYPFNGNTNDESGNGNHGTNYGATLANDRFGNGNSAYSFNGINEYISVNDNASLKPSIISISVWVNVAPNQDPFMRIISKQYNEPQNFGSYQIITGNSNGNGKVGMTVRTGSGNSQSTNGIYNWTGDVGSNIVNTWQHIVGVFDGTTVKLYQNSIFVTQVNQSGNLHYDLSNLLIAKGVSGGSLPGTEIFYNGLIDDIGIWNRALTPCEINQLYESQLLDNQESISEASCESYDWNGQTYTSSGIYPQSFTNQYGCDSTVTLDLTIDSIDNTVEQNNLLLTSNQNNAAYQWINCENNTPIQGATDISLQVEENGSYAVAIENGSCQDTSDCIVIENVGVNEVDINHITIYPNPTKDQFTVKINDAESYELKVYDLKGQLLQNDFLTGTNTINLNTYESGVYLIHISNNTYNKHFKLIVE